MREQARVVQELVGDRLEHFSPLELRRYLAAWSGATFEQFCTEAEACKAMAERQIRVIEVEDDDLEEWVHTLLLIEGSLSYARTVHTSLTLNQRLHPEGGLEYFLPSKGDYTV